MPEKEAFRLGVFFSDENRPSLEELADALDDKFIERDTEKVGEDEEKELRYMDKGRRVRIHRGGNGYDFCHFRYVSDTKESYRIRTEDDEEVDQNETRLASSRVLYFENGQFAFESNRDIEEPWIPRFIGRATDYEISGSDYRLYNLNEEFMANAYSNYDIVTKLKLSESTNGDGSSEELGSFIQDLIGEVTSFEFSSGGDENLKDKSAIDTCAENLNITRMNAKHEDGLMKEFTGSSVKQTLDFEDANSDNVDEQIRRESLAARDIVQDELKRLREVYDD